MEEIIRVLIGCLIFCIMNTGIIYILDKIQKLIGKEKTHIIKVMMLFAGACMFYIFSLGYYHWNKWIVIELSIVLAVELAEYAEEITLKAIIEISSVNFVSALLLSVRFDNLDKALILFLCMELYMLFMYLVAALTKYREFDLLEIKFIQICVSTVIVNILFEMITPTAGETWNLIIEIVLIIVLTFEIIGYWLKEYYYSINEMNKKTEYANQQYEVERVQKMYEESRKLRHDLKQCLMTVTGFIEDGRDEDAKEFLKRIMSERIENDSYRKFCDNKVLNYILNDKNNKCRKQNITFTCMVLGRIRFIDDIDMSILIGNIVDNAIEAAAKSREPYVDIEIAMHGGIFINVENSIKDSFLSRSNPFLTTKLNQDKHGIGTKSIYDIVKKYNGEIIYEEKDKSVMCHVFLSTKNI